MKIISMILAFIMSLLGLAPAATPVDAYTQAEWYALVADEFNLTYDLDDEHNYDIAEDDEYYEVLQACYDWEVLVGEYDADADVTNFIVGKSLAVAAGLEGANDADDDFALDVAVDAGIVDITLTFFGKAKEAVISKTDANAALKAAGLAYMNSLKDVENGGDLETENGEEYNLNSLALVENSNGLTLQTADGDVIDEDEIAYLDYEGKVNPFEQPEIAGINQQSILEKIDVSFSIGDLDVSAAVKDGGFDISLGGPINGVYVKKSYEVRNFDLYTKFEGRLDETQITKSYVFLDYNLKDSTEITGSYDWSLDEIETPEGTNDVDFFTRVTENMEFVKGADSEIEVFSVDVAIPNCPAITIGITAKLVISFDGRVELILTSKETRGVEIIDNKVRLISESKALDSALEMEARIEAVLGLYVDISVVNIVLVDAGIEVGIGVHVTVYMTGGADNYHLDIPYDFLFDMNFTVPNAENMTFEANVKVYGIVTISVGENSDILEPLGLCETWSICNEGNATFIDETFVLNKAA
ncbi:MAG: hypothetical protein IIW48_03395 [Clostridia bacterium]|nr:hypothetical protein [Clostridia bacterium]